MNTVVRRCTLAFFVLYASCAMAEQRTLDFADVGGDSLTGAAGSGDLTHLRVTFDPATGAYAASFTAAPSSPFLGDIELDLHLFNADIATFDPENAEQYGELHDVINIYHFALPQQSVTLTGTSAALMHWTGGQHVRAHAAGESGGGVSGVYTAAGPYQPIDDFPAGVLSVVEPAPVVTPAVIRILFSGTFASCTQYPCNGTPFAQLAGTPFSGELRFPNLAVDARPDDPRSGLYNFPTDAVMSLHTNSGVFDLPANPSVSLFVHNCIGSSCAFKDDYVIFQVYAGGYVYNLRLSSPHPPFVTDAIPSAAQLSGLYASFEFYTQDFSFGIGTDVLNNPVTSPMTLVVTTLPTQPVPGTRRVPAMPPICFALLFALLCGIQRGLSRH